MNGVQTRFKCKLDVKRCKRFVFPPSSLLPRSNALKTKAIRYFQTDRTLTRIVSPPLSEDEPGNGSVPYILSQTTGTTLDSRWLYSSNYLRIKNLTLGYKLPINPKFISYARVYLSIENLAKWDSYYGGYSPEAANVGSGPGGASALGLDYGGYPNARTFTFGINVNF